MKILIIGPAWIGDMVMAQVLFMLLKQDHPNATIDVIAPEWTKPHQREYEYTAREHAAVLYTLRPLQGAEKLVLAGRRSYPASSTGMRW